MRRVEHAAWMKPVPVCRCRRCRQYRDEHELSPRADRAWGVLMMSVAIGCGVAAVLAPLFGIDVGGARP